MIRTITRTLTITGAMAAVLAVLAAPTFAHLIEYKPVAKFGSPGTGVGQFNTPVGVAIDESDGNVYVVDRGNNRVELFDANGAYLSEIDGGETPAKALAEPTSIAVDNSNDSAKGRLYVADPNQELIDAFDQSGKYLFQVKTESPRAITTDTSGHLWVWTGQLSIEEYDDQGNQILRSSVESHQGAEPGIAVDSRGNVYTADSSGCIDRYSPPSFEYEAKSQGCKFRGVVLAIDPSSNNIFQDSRSSIVEWPPFGEGPELWEKAEELIGGAFAESEGLAINGSTGRLYVSDESANDVEVLNGVVSVLPVVEGTPVAANVTRSSAVIHTKINPRGIRATFHVLYVEAAEYQPSATNPYEAGAVTPTSNVPAGTSGQEIEQLVGGLKPNTTYHYQIVANDQAGRATGSDETFTTDAPTPPVAVSGDASGVEQNVATISGVVDTSGLPSTYGFEVATGTDYGPPTGLGSVGAGLSEAPVSLALTGLVPGVTYRYRLTVTNLDGTSYGEDRTFTTAVFASTFAVPPAPLPFVSVPSFVFPSESRSTVVKKKVKAKAKSKKRLKAKGKKKRKKSKKK